jgi:MEMO1 family protein
MTLESDTLRPRLRDIIDVQPIVHAQQPYLLLRDVLDLSQKHLLIPRRLAPLLGLCDGSRDIVALQASLLIRFGVQVARDEIDQIIRALDDACLLDNKRFQNAQKQALLDFRQAAFRAPACTPHVYPDDPSELNKLLESYLTQVRSIHPVPGQAPVRGVVSPHIDYDRGGPVYARTWLEAEPACQTADVAVIFGTDHHGNELFTLTYQHYATPYGLLPTDQQAVQVLAEAIGEDRAFSGELRHRKEHSVELAAVWLHHLRGGEPIDLIPVLCTYPELASDHDLVEKFLDLLSKVLAGRRPLIIAAADLSHVGPAFGGEPLDERKLARLKADDDRLLDSMRSGDAGGFLHQIAQGNNQNNVCGVGPIYYTLRCLSSTHGLLTSYDSCPADQQDTSVVTICGMLFD